jgi:hypothetical protein
MLTNKRVYIYWGETKMQFGSKTDTTGTTERKAVVGELRRPQLITSFGSGAIADMPNYSIVVAAADYWKKNSPLLHEPNLEKLLKVKEFRQPYVSDNNNDYPQDDIPAFRFPLMHFCPGCGRLMPFWAFGSSPAKKCERCGKPIVPSRFVAACINGHLEDFPYDWWIHYGKLSDCNRKGTNADLQIKFKDTTGGLDSIIVKCNHCGKERSMAGSLSNSSLKGYKCHGKRPWIGNGKEHNDPVECKAPMRALQRGASNLYFTITVSALTIPPWSNKIQIAIDENWDKISMGWSSNPNAQTRKSWIDLLFGNFLNNGTSHETIENEITKRFNNKEDDKFSEDNIYEEEYKVFCGEDQDDFQFKTAQTSTPAGLKPYISKIVLVKRLREILALKGFRRISPEIPSRDNDVFTGYNFDTEKNCISLFKDEPTWLPAVELLGEGIFIRLDEKKLNKWVAEYMPRYSILEKRLQKSSMIKCDNFSPIYILLHTLSHLLIRQFSLECGYSAASVKERIYCTYPGSAEKMAGILIYTSSSDSDGSLGGLVRQGLAESFEPLFLKMLKDATWCSSDPVCLKSMSQGFDSLNLAACHACTLLPETCCERRNCLLDRVAIVGNKLNPDEPDSGYFSELIYQEYQYDKDGT